MKIFVILSRIPYPLEKGDKLRAYHQLKLLNRKHTIHLCCLSFTKITPAAEAQVKQICSELTIVRLSYLALPFYLLAAFFSRKPLQVGYFFQLRAFKKVRRAISHFSPDHIYAQLLRTAEYVKDLHDIPKTIDYQDAFSAGVQRRETRAGLFTRPVIASEKRRLRHYENLIFEYFDYKTIISEQDRNAIPHPRKNEILIVPNGVDFTTFFPLELPRSADILFAGNMNYPPNIDSVAYLINDIMPEVWKNRPQTTVVICGATPGAKTRQLASDKVEITGWVEDINKVYNSAKLLVAPMFMGAGLQNKLLEAMACKIPCITSPLANNALKADEGKEIMIGHSTGDYAEKIITLLDNETKRRQLSENGFVFVKQNYTWESSVEVLERCFLNRS